jgi:hypothetical protein
MSTHEEIAPPGHNRVVYILVGIIVVLATILGVIVYDYASDNADAKDKANQLIAAVEKAGYPAPSQKQVVNTLGTDGGPVCEDPNSNLSKAILYSQLTNGAAGPGQRPTIVDKTVVQGQLLIISIYCPDQLSDFEKQVSDLKFDDVTGD